MSSSNLKKRQHYVPKMYLKAFFSEVDDESIRARQGQLSCYRAPEKRHFFDKGHNICWEKLLYEYSTDGNMLNIIENSFNKNVEMPMSYKLRKMIRKLDVAEIGDIVLTEDEIHYLHKYINIQLLRNPETMSKTLKFILELARELAEDEKETIDKKEALLQVSDLESELSKNIEKIFFDNFDTVILKSENFGFFTSNVPVIVINLDSASKAYNIFSSVIFMPINKDYCIKLSPRRMTDLDERLLTGLSLEYLELNHEESIKEIERQFAEMKKDIKDGQLRKVEDDTLQYTLLMFNLCVADVIVADHMSDDFINRINFLYPIALENRRKKNEDLDALLREYFNR